MISVVIVAHDAFDLNQCPPRPHSPICYAIKFNAPFWEVDVHNVHIKAMVLLALIGVFMIACPLNLSAKEKKYTLEQAWAICKAQIDKTVPKDNSGARYAAGGACMLRHGYRI
jgi:hypothetical protein